MKKLLNLLSIFTVLVLVLTACGGDAPEVTDTSTQAVTNESDAQLQVVVTMFSQYDFANEVGGQHVNVSRLVPPGVDIHSFEPTPQDIIAINEADLFIYTGAEMEPWVHRILESLDRDDLTILDVSQGVSMLEWYGTNNPDEDHSHTHSDDHHNHDDDHGHTHDYDPHIWTSPLNAMVMVRNIEAQLIALMPEQTAFFTQHANELMAELEALDDDFRELMADTTRTIIYHAGRFALHYLMHEYGIDVVSAPLESEPDTALVARMITEMKEDDIPVIFHEELVNPQTAHMIAAETGAEALLLHTIHNVSADEIAAGQTYVSFMRHNLEVLRRALNE